MFDVSKQFDQSTRVSLHQRSWRRGVRRSIWSMQWLHCNCWYLCSIRRNSRRFIFNFNSTIGNNIDRQQFNDDVDHSTSHRLPFVTEQLSTLSTCFILLWRYTSLYVRIESFYCRLTLCFLLLHQGRLCHGSYHWRCVKPETISYYSDSTHFICDRCNDSMTTPTTSTSTTAAGSANSSYRTGIQIKSANALNTDYRDFVHVPTRSNLITSQENNVVHTIRFFEKKQQESPARIQSNGQRLLIGNGKCSAIEMQLSKNECARDDRVVSIRMTFIVIEKENQLKFIW